MISFLVVTNRPKFFNWCMWNIFKQTYDGPAEVIVIDNTDYSKIPDEEMPVSDALVTPKMILSDEPVWPIHATFVEPGLEIGQYRQMALDEAKGDFITFVDDDDWHHPKRTEWLMDGIEDYQAALLQTEIRLVMETMTMFPYREGIGYPYIPFMVVRREIAQSIKFPSKSLGEDTDWTDELIEKVGWEEIHRVRRHFPSMILIHGDNTYHLKDKFDVDIDMDGQPLPKEAPFGVDEDEWRETLRRLEELR